MTRSQPESFTPFEKLLVDLAHAGIDFAVVGGVAVSLNGFVRATEDIDILVADSRENIQRLVDCLRQWGEGWARELQIEDFAPQEGSIRVTEDFPLDIFTRMQGHSLEDFRPRLQRFETGGERIAYLAAEDLILLKKQSWRDKDRIDVAALEKIVRGTTAD